MHLDEFASPLRPQVLKHLVLTWGRLGRLVIPGGERGRRSVIEEVPQLPQELRKMWRIALKKYRFLVIDAAGLPFDEINNTVLFELKKEIDVYGHSIEECPEIGEFAPSKIPEFIVAGDLARSKSFLDALERADRGIAKDSSTNTVFSGKFAALMGCAERIVVVDRYCLNRFFRDFELSGLARIIQEIGRYSQKNLSVFASYNDNDLNRFGADNMWAGVREHLETLNQQHNLDQRNVMSIWMIPDSLFRDHHDRYIEFDYQVLELGTGLEVLQGVKCRRDSTCTLKVISGLHREKLKDLQLAATRGYNWSSDQRSSR